MYFVHLTILIIGSKTMSARSCGKESFPNVISTTAVYWKHTLLSVGDEIEIEMVHMLTRLMQTRQGVWEPNFTSESFYESVNPFFVSTKQADSQGQVNAPPAQGICMKVPHNVKLHYSNSLNKWLTYKLLLLRIGTEFSTDLIALPATSMISWFPVLNPQFTHDCCSTMKLLHICFNTKKSRENSFFSFIYSHFSFYCSKTFWIKLKL